MYLAVDEIDKGKIKEDFNKTKQLATKYLTKETLKQIRIAKILPNITELRLYPCEQFPEGYITTRCVSSITEGKKFLIGLLIKEFKTNKITKLLDIKNELVVEDSREIFKICDMCLSREDRSYEVLLEEKNIGNLYDYLSNKTNPKI